MKVAVVRQPGDASVFEIEERPLPVPEKGQVLISVKAFGLNRSELMTRKGLSPDVRFPRVLGIECVGVVEIDPDRELEKGQKVFAFMGGMGRDFDGSYGEYTVLPKSIVSPFHSALAWPTLGALPEMFQTAHGSLYSALGVKRGERLLIRGGTSSVGLLATQMAAAEGITVIATTRTPEKRAVLLKNGASDVLIDQGVLRDNLPQSVDKVLELVGTTTLGDSLRCVRPGGTVCMAGMLSEQWSMKDFSPMDFIPSSVNLTIYDSGQMRVEPSAFQEFLNRVSAGEITPPIKAVFRLDQINEAHRLMESNSGAGKIVVYL